MLWNGFGNTSSYIFKNLHGSKTFNFYDKMLLNHRNPKTSLKRVRCCSLLLIHKTFSSTSNFVLIINEKIRLDSNGGSLFFVPPILRKDKDDNCI